MVRADIRYSCGCGFKATTSRATDSESQIVPTLIAQHVEVTGHVVTSIVGSIYRLPELAA